MSSIITPKNPESLSNPPKIENFSLEGPKPIDPMLETLSGVEATLRKHFEIVDWQGVELLLAAAVAHYAPGEMLWLREIGPSRSGKTELLRAISGHPDCARMEAITPAALRGGLKEGAKLLARIDGKLVITKDLATLLTTRKDARTEIFGLLRPIKDGELISDFGSDEGYLPQKAKFDWIVATTPAFEQHRQLESLLGERFIDLRWIPGNREDMAYRAGTNNPYLESIRIELATSVCSLMERAKASSFMTLSEAEIRIISEFGDKTARLRTPVQRDKLRNLVSYPEPEIGTDLTQGFCRLVQGLKVLGLTRYGPYINRLLWDCMPKLRSQVLGCLVRGETSADNIAKETKLSKRTIDYQLEDLRLLETVDADNQLLHAIIHM
ncbi:MAG: hypothetical protein ISS58_07860 [Dehalococcoidales bacterium]|nr:hypothetical protein [Dehalococcoidales bacterium]